MKSHLKIPALFIFALLVPAVCRAFAPSEELVTFPEHRNIVNVTKPPYNAKGDGVTDDTAALQLAINENTGHHRMLYFPSGTYLVSATLTWPKKWEEHDNWGFTWLQGESASKSVIRLKDATLDFGRFEMRIDLVIDAHELA